MAERQTEDELKIEEKELVKKHSVPKMESVTTLKNNLVTASAS